jgi:hypothetical protein
MTRFAICALKWWQSGESTGIRLTPLFLGGTIPWWHGLA